MIAGVRVREWDDPGARGTLLWPGLGLTGLAFTPLVHALPRAVAVDPPGHGGSPDRAWEEYELSRLGDLAHELLDETRSDAFLGHSWGGTLGVVLGATYPEALRALVLLDGGFVSGEARSELGLPSSDDRDVLIAYAREHTSEHDSWEAAFDELRALFDGGWPDFAEA
jgi:pimeloyl-ACP methyl ester carboxylesterase